jgi:hypothetical protein
MPVYVSKKALKTFEKEVKDSEYYERSEKFSETDPKPAGYWLVPDTKFEALPDGVKPSLLISRVENGFDFDRVVHAPIDLSGIIFIAAPGLPPKFAETIRYWGREPLGGDRATQAIYHQNGSHEYMVNLKSGIDLQFIANEIDEWWQSEGKIKFPEIAEQSAKAIPGVYTNNVPNDSPIGKAATTIQKVMHKYGMDLYNDLPEKQDRYALYSLLVSTNGDDQILLMPEIEAEPEYKEIVDKIRADNFWERALMRGEELEDKEDDNGHLLITEGQVIHLTNLPEIIEQNNLEPHQFIRIDVPLFTNAEEGPEGDFIPGSTQYEFNSENFETIFLKVSDILASPDPENVYIDLLRYEMYDYGYYY